MRCCEPESDFRPPPESFLACNPPNTDRSVDQRQESPNCPGLGRALRARKMGIGPHSSDPPPWRQTHNRGCRIHGTVLGSHSPWSERLGIESWQHWAEVPFLL